MNAQSQPACRLHINLLETAHPLSLACTSINLDAASDKTLPRSCDCPGSQPMKESTIFAICPL